MRSRAIQQEPGILTSLRQETHDLHKTVERRALIAGLLSESLTPAVYTACLSRLEQFHRSLESSVESLLGAIEGLQLPSRRKTIALRHDLAHFGHDPAEPIALFEIGTQAEAWGALYVVEGATMGGQVITRHLTRHDWLSQTAGRLYFSGYGPTTDMMWTQFRTALIAAAGDSERFADAVVGSARRTFKRLDEQLAG